MSYKAAQAHCDAVRTNQAMKDAELVTALQRELAAAQAKLSEVEAERVEALKEDAERLINLVNDALLSYHEVTNNEWRKRAHAAIDAARKKDPTR